MNHKPIIFLHYVRIFRSVCIATSLVFGERVFSQISIVALYTLVSIITVGFYNPFKT